ncbi:hypothetical protein D9756_007505 [Leucocoprinus leucothites]|uniref:Uncharacterized protein n=1 Tax=Leucocoprinus leucothites TaxID=201217 RepID=A0A8H5D3G8_9AGAR|nr:hypothetical protein D9756_007505 [Leucoagaricus leucothites]
MVRSKPTFSPPATTRNTGRAIRRLVSCFDNVLAITGESDRRILMSGDSDDPLNQNNEDDEESTRNHDRLFSAFGLLVKADPHIKPILKSPDPDTLRSYATTLQEGANAARSDDINRIKADLAFYLNKRIGAADPLSPRSRVNRGLQHDVCGRLLTPIEVDWDDLEVRASIRNGTESFNINNSFYLRCLYPNGMGDANNAEDGFLRGGLLIMAYRSIFMSLTRRKSELDNSIEGGDQATALLNRNMMQQTFTRASVASTLRMDGKATGRSIAYVATILVFNLTDAARWRKTYNGFNFQAFYNFLVDYFENVPDNASRRQASVNSLLTYWNGMIFPDPHASYKKLQAQRAARHREAQLTRQASG